VKSQAGGCSGGQLWQAQTGFVAPKVFELHRRERKAASSALAPCRERGRTKACALVAGVDWPHGGVLPRMSRRRREIWGPPRNEERTKVRGVCVWGTAASIDPVRPRKGTVLHLGKGMFWRLAYFYAGVAWRTGPV
jgi:hypothetical protein